MKNSLFQIVNTPRIASCNIQRCFSVLYSLLMLFYLFSQSSSAQSPPTISSHTPAKNALIVAKNENIIITFSKDMNSVTLNNSTIKVQGWQSGLHLGLITYDSETKTATFNPNTDFKNGEIVNVSLTSGIQSNDGGVLKSYVWNFAIVTTPSSGVFTTKVDYETGTGPGSVFVSDLDGDSDGDVVVANLLSNTISVLKNNGDGTFASKVDYATVDNPLSVFINDLDSDGDEDVVVTKYFAPPSIISVHKNNGNGTFASGVDYTTVGNPLSVFISDIDGDGDGDLVVADDGIGKISVLKNNGDGTFATHIDYEMGEYTGPLFISDIDGDGDGDVVATNYNLNKVAILKNNGDGTFASKVDYPTGTGPSSIFVSDLDGDGDGDLVIANKLSGTISILKNNGDGTFNAKIDYETISPTSVFVSDIDGDGDGDLLVGTDGKIFVLKNNGDGTFASKVDYQTGAGPSSIFVSDLDGDGDGDLVVANYLSNTISVLKNPDVVAMGSICGVKFNDIDGDGIRDLGEPLLPYWPIDLTGDATHSITTDFQGQYCFSSLNPGLYTVCEGQQSGWTPTTPVCQTVTVGLGQSVTVNFGNQCAPCNGAPSDLNFGTYDPTLCPSKTVTWEGLVSPASCIVGDETQGKIIISADPNSSIVVYSILPSNLSDGNGNSIPLSISTASWTTDTDPPYTFWLFNPNTPLTVTLGPSGTLCLQYGGTAISSGQPPGCYTKVIIVQWQYVGSIVKVQSKDGNTDSIGVRATIGSKKKWSARQGWNMISNPMQTVNDSVEVIFPSAISQAFTYLPSSGYAQRNVVEHGKGYWLKFTTAESLSIIGFPMRIDTIAVYEGWNMIGSISDPIPTVSITSDKTGMITSQFFGYTNSYYDTDTIYPGAGYWVKVNQDGNLILSCESAALIKLFVSRIRIVTTSELPPSLPDNVEVKILSKEFSLQQNYPNPFNPTTTIKYDIPKVSMVTLKVYNLFGQELTMLVSEEQSAGYKSVKFDGSNLPSGIYYYRLQAGKYSDVKKMLLIK